MIMSKIEEDVGRIPLQGGLQADGPETTERAIRRLGLPLAGGCDSGGEFEGGGDLRLLPPEHIIAVYCD